AAAAAAPRAAAAERTLVWANKGADMTEAGNWFLSDGQTVADTAPTAEDRLHFADRPGVQPYLGSTLTVKSLRFGPAGSSGSTAPDAGDGFDGFGASGWNITGAPGAQLVFPGAWNEAKNYNYAVSQSTLGTNTIAVPVRFTSSSSGNNRFRSMTVIGGRLEFAAPVAADSRDACLLVGGSSYNGTLALLAANPEIPRSVQLEGGVALAFSSAGALSGVTNLVLNQGAGVSNRQAVRNETGGDVSLPGLLSITATAKNENCHFEGDGAMSFPDAAFAPRLNDAREFYVDVPMAVKTLGNAYAGAGAFAFRKRGPAALRVADDVFQGAPEGQTNRIDIVDGALVLENDGYLSRDFLLFGVNGYFFETDGNRPVLGLLHDLAVPEGGAVPGGFATWGDRAWNAGFAAFGGDRTVTLAGGGTYKLLDSSDSGEKLAALPSHGVNGNGGWWKRAYRLVFGAAGADGTVTLADGVDVNVANSSASANSRTFWAVAGAAPVAGRISGCITNSGAAGLSGSRIFKDGDGVLALDGRCELASANQSFVRQGGLLVNGSAAGPFSATNTLAGAPYAWLGGTGRFESTVTVWNGGALRPGDERGAGSTEIAGSLVLKDGARIILNLGADSHSSVRFTGTGCDYRAEGSVTVEIDAAEGLEKGRSVAVFDWSGAASPNYGTMVDVSRYRFDLPEDSPVHHPALYKDGETVYLKFSVDTGRPFKVLFD
ncbi:MAG: hypothetical protein IJ783_09105, partial [Kiritimatiellae bacterium]|nr:hypothetical protein [Kiritimatiellia bacterium]